MILESILAFLHISAILALVVFLTSEAALCRADWMNARIVERLVTVDRIYVICLLAVLVTGILRIAYGIKGASWYLHDWLLHAKIGLFVIAALISIAPTLRFRRWRAELRATGALPPPEQVKKVRGWVMIQAHIIPIIPLFAVFLARGFGGR